MNTVPSPRRILIVDDEPAIIAALHPALHAGILALRDDEAQQRELEQLERACEERLEPLHVRLPACALGRAVPQLEGDDAAAVEKLKAEIRQEALEGKY